MHAIAVGKPYVPGRISLLPHAEYNFRRGQHELLLCLAQITEGEVKAVRRGEAAFALVVADEVIFLLYRFGAAIQWSDAPYSWHLAPESQRALPDILATAETRALLQVVLVDADRNVVRARRAISFSPGFSAALHAAIREQAARPWNAPAYGAAIRAGYRHWPTSESMLVDAIAQTTGGA